MDNYVCEGERRRKRVSNKGFAVLVVDFFSFLLQCMFK